MSVIHIHFKHPFQNSTLPLRLEDDITAKDTIHHLMNQGFLGPHSAGYQLAINDAFIEEEMTLLQAGIRDGNTLQVVQKLNATQEIKPFKIYFKHPESDTLCFVKVISTDTILTAFERLVEKDFMPRLKSGYFLKQGDLEPFAIQATIAELGLGKGDVIELMPVFQSELEDLITIEYNHEATLEQKETTEIEEEKKPLVPVENQTKIQEQLDALKAEIESLKEQKKLFEKPLSRSHESYEDIYTVMSSLRGKTVNPPKSSYYKGTSGISVLLFMMILLALFSTLFNLYYDNILFLLNLFSIFG